ncbi:hypothetical protein [Sphingobium limneticum]|nr:hypothetical protein [Sphingobium limneticum]
MMAAAHPRQTKSESFENALEIAKAEVSATLQQALKKFGGFDQVTIPSM